MATIALPYGWRWLTSRDIWDGEGPRARPVLYAVDKGWMVAGVRSAEELKAIAEIVSSPLSFMSLAEFTEMKTEEQANLRLKREATE